MVNLTIIEDDEIEFVRNLIARHFELTNSRKAEEILHNWETASSKFTRVIPKDYQRIMESQKQAAESDLPLQKSEGGIFSETVTAA